MTTENRELFTQGTAQDPHPRIAPIHSSSKRFKPVSGGPTLAQGTPVAYDTNADGWVAWSAAVSEVTSITAATTTATDGTFTLTINGVTTGTIDHDADAAAIKAAIVASGAADIDDLTVVDSGGGLAANDGVATITWGGDLAGQVLTITADFGSLVGNAHTLAEETAGVDSYDAHTIRGFVLAADGIVLNDTGGDDVLGEVMTHGSIHYDDITVPTGETEANMKAALKDGPGSRGLVIQGLIDVR